MTDPAIKPPRARSRPGDLFIQAALLIAVVSLCAWFAHNAAVNAATQGLRNGWAFLDRSAGFDISQTLIPYAPSDPVRRVFLVGALNTLVVAVLSILSATMIGVMAGLARRSGAALVRAAALAYVELARNAPLPIQILIWYALLLALPAPRNALSLGDLAHLSNRGLYLPLPLGDARFWPTVGVAALCLVVGLALSVRYRRKRAIGVKAPAPGLPLAAGAGAAIVAFLVTGNPSGMSFPRFTGFDFEGGLVLSPALVALWLGLSVYTAAYIAEIVRAGLQSVAGGQWDAARALGLSARQSLRLVVAPQALRVAVPPLVSQYLNIAKNASLAVIVGYPDLVSVFAGTALNQTGQAIETIGMVLLFYLCISLSISGFMSWWNRRSAHWEQR